MFVRNFFASNNQGREEFANKSVLGDRCSYVIVLCKIINGH